MEIEQLKLIIDAFGGLTTDAYAAFIVWMVYQYFTSILWAGVLFGLAFLLYKTVWRLVRIPEYLKEVASAVDASFYGDPDPGDIAQIHRRIRELKEAKHDK